MSLVAIPMLQGLAEIEAGALEASSFVLFESRLGPGGAAYTPLATFSPDPRGA